MSDFAKDKNVAINNQFIIFYWKLSLDPIYKLEALGVNFCVLLVELLYTMLHFTEKLLSYFPGSQKGKYVNNLLVVQNL